MKIKNIVTVLLVAFILASCAPAAKVVSTEAAAPTSTFTPVPPTNTPTPPVPMIEVKDAQGNVISVPDPKVSNPELFDIKNADSPIVEFANAFGIKPEEVGNLTPQLLTGVDGKQFVVMTTGDLAATADFDESGTPLMIAQQGENGEWKWSETSFRNSGFMVGTTVDGAEDFRNPNYQRAAADFPILFPAGSFLQSTIDQWGTGMVDTFSRNAVNNNQILYIHPGFWHQDIPQNVDDISQFMQKRVDFLLDIAARSKGASPVYINFYNEALRYNPSRPNDIWENSPYHDLFGDDVIAQTYVMFFERAQEKGLVIGEDVRLVYSDYDYFAPGAKSDIVFDNLMSTKQRIAEELGIPVDEVRIDLGMQFHIAHTPDQSKGYFGIPTDQEFLDNLTRFSQIGDIHITEFDVLDGSLQEKQETIRHFIDLSRQSGVVSDVTLWYTLRKGEGNGIFNLDDYSKTSFYYILLRDLLIK